LIIHRRPVGSRDLEIHINDPEATVADLFRALDPDRPVTSLRVDGRTVAASTPLDRAALGDGSEVRTDDPPEAPDHDPPKAVVEVLSGLDSGRVHDLPAGRFLLGRPTGGDGEELLAVHDPTVGRRQT